MISEIRDLLAMVEKLPDMVLHVLVGFGIYKLVVFLGTSAGIYGTIRLAINKLYAYKELQLTKPVERVVKINDRFITEDGTMDTFLDFLSEIRNRRPEGRFRSNFLHRSDVDEFRKAWKQYTDARDGVSK